MGSQSRISYPRLVFRWLIGMALVTWRYMWQTTPLHRTEQTVREAPEPPPLPDDVVDEKVLLAENGRGPLFHRRFRVVIRDAKLDAPALMEAVRRGMGDFVPKEVVGIRHEPPRELQVGDEFVVDMPGPWNGPVRVVHTDAHRLRLATLEGHLEAGQIEFRARHDGPMLVWEIEAWARPSTRIVNLLYSHFRLAKEVQLNMWVRFCKRAVVIAGGHGVQGVQVHTDTFRG